MGVDILNSRQVTLSGCVPSETTIYSTNRSSVKRSLFGPVDHQESMSFIQKEFAKMEKEKMQKWNFDFHNGKPLPGAFKWEKVPAKSPQVISKISPSFKVTKLKSPRKFNSLRNLKRSLNHDSINRRQTTITDFVNITKKSIEGRRIEIDSIRNKSNQSQNIP